MEQILFVKFLENMITLCQETLAEVSAKPVTKTIEVEVPITLPFTNGVRSWLAWVDVNCLRKNSRITRAYQSGITGISDLKMFTSPSLMWFCAYKVEPHSCSCGDIHRAKFDMDRFRRDYEAGFVHWPTTDKSMPLERPLSRQSSLIDMVIDEPIGCDPVPESDNKELRFQALSEQLLAAVLRRDQVGIGDYRNIARETGSNMAEIRQTLERLASEPLNLLNRRATVVGTVYTPAE